MLQLTMQSKVLSVSATAAFLAKTDIESTFRLIPVHPDGYELLNMYWDGRYYHDKVLTFVLQSALYLFNQLSDVILSWSH